MSSLVKSMSSKTNKTSDDEFESADEGDDELMLSSSSKSAKLQNKKTTAVTDGWDDWNMDDDDDNDSETLINDREQTKTSLSKAQGDVRLSSAEDDSADPSDQQRIQRKKFHKKVHETSTRSSRPVERRDEEAAPKSTHHGTDLKDTHQLFDRLAAQSPTRVVN